MLARLGIQRSDVRQIDKVKTTFEEKSSELKIFKANHHEIVLPSGLLNRIRTNTRVTKSARSGRREFQVPAPINQNLNMLILIVARVDPEVEWPIKTMDSDSKAATANLFYRIKLKSIIP
jgi:hypothetical protein